MYDNLRILFSFLILLLSVFIQDIWIIKRKTKKRIGVKYCFAFGVRKFFDSIFFSIQFQIFVYFDMKRKLCCNPEAQYTLSSFTGKSQIENQTAIYVCLCQRERENYSLSFLLFEHWRNVESVIDLAFWSRENHFSLSVFLLYMCMCIVYKNFCTQHVR